MDERRNERRVVIICGGRLPGRRTLMMQKQLRANGFEVEIQEDTPQCGGRRPDRAWLDEMASLSRAVAKRLVETADGTAEGRAQARKEWLRSLRRKKGGY